MNAPSQTTPAGWFYADTKPSTHTTAWDGKMWPEITGYKGTNVPASLPAGFVDQLVQVQLTEDLPASGKPAVLPIGSSTPALEARDFGADVAESHAVAIALGDDGRASASGTLVLYLLLALVLAVVSIIIGVVL